MMPIQPYQIRQAISLIENRIGLSSTTLERIKLGDLLMQIAGDEIEEYLYKLKTQESTTKEWQRLLHALMIGETYFMRDTQHFDILRESLLPRLMLSRRRTNKLEMTIWCVGCATGEEPYSIATVIREVLPDFPDWKITILGTDLNQNALDTAESAIYRRWSFRHASPNFINRYFNQIDDNHYQLIQPIQDMVTFKLHNIKDKIPIFGVDVIFCRNVLMYFNDDHVQKIEQSLYDALSPGGWLLLGQAETLHSQNHNWTMHLHPGVPIYQKPSSTQPLSTTPITYPTKQYLRSDNLPDDDANSLYSLAIEAVHEDKHHRAEIYIGRVLAENPKHAHAHVLLASIFANRKAYDEALAHIDEALKFDALLADAHYIRALIEIEQNNIDDAIQSLSAAIYSQRDHPLASFTLGNLLSQRNEVDRANTNWRNAQRALINCNEDDYVSDLSDMKVNALKRLLEARLL